VSRWRARLLGIDSVIQVIYRFIDTLATASPLGDLPACHEAALYLSFGRSAASSHAFPGAGEVRTGTASATACVGAAYSRTCIGHAEVGGCVKEMQVGGRSEVFSVQRVIARPLCNRSAHSSVRCSGLRGEATPIRVDAGVCFVGRIAKDTDIPGWCIGTKFPNGISNVGAARRGRNAAVWDRSLSLVGFGSFFAPPPRPLTTASSSCRSEPCTRLEGSLAAVLT
jgi:hypothetical protein